MGFSTLFSAGSIFEFLAGEICFDGYQAFQILSKLFKTLKILKVVSSFSSQELICDRTTIFED